MSENFQSQQLPSDAWRALYQNLQWEDAALQELQKILKRKQKAIISGELRELQTLTSREQLLAHRMRELTDKRVALIGKIFSGFDTVQDSISLGRLINYLHPSLQATWRELEEKMKSAVREIDRVNHENMELLKASLAFSRKMVELLFPPSADALETYDKDGETKKDRTRKVLDYQI